MGRKRKEGGIVRKSFTFTEDQARLITYYASLNKFGSETEFLGWLIENYNSSSDPIKEMKLLKKEEEDLKEKLEELNRREKIALKHMEEHKLREKLALKHMEEHKLREKLRKEKILEAIEIIRRKIMSGESMSEVERIAKNWAIRINVDAYELIFRATKEQDLNILKNN